MPLHVVAKGALIGGGVGAALAALRRPAEGQADPGKLKRIAKSTAEGAIAGAAVGFVLDRSLRRRTASLLAANAPVVLEAVSELAQRYEPVVERLAEAVFERAVDAYEAARPLVVDAYESARPRVVEAYETARPRVEDAAQAVRARALELRPA
jgi:hypothetical protein